MGLLFNSPCDGCYNSHYDHTPEREVCDGADENSPKDCPIFVEYRKKQSEKDGAGRQK